MALFNTSGTLVPQKWRYLFWFFLTFFSFVGFSQPEIKVRWGDPEIVKFRNYYTPAPFILGEQNGELFISTTLKGQVTLRKYDLGSLNMTNLKLLPSMGKYLASTILSLEYFDSHIRYCYLTSWNDTKIKIYTYGIDDFTLKDEKKLLFRKILNLENFEPEYYYSEDLVFVLDRLDSLSETPFESRYRVDFPKFDGYLYDKSGAQIYKNTISLPTEKFVVEDVKIGSDSVIYILGFSYEGKVKFKLSFESKDRYPPGDFMVVKWDLKNDQKTTKVIKIGGRYVFDIDLSIRKNFLQVIGFSSSTKKGFNNVFTERFDLNTLASNFKKVIDIPNEIIYKTWRESEISKSEKKIHGGDYSKSFKPYLDSFDKMKILTDDNGNIYVTAQEALYSIGSDDINNKINGANYVRYGKILVLKLNKSFELVWSDMVSKNQYTMKDRGLEFSYFPFLLNNRFFLMYNNTEKYDHLLFKGLQFNKGSANLAKLKNQCFLVYYNSIGKRIRKSTIETAHENAKILPLSTFIRKNEELVLISKYKNKIWVGILPLIDIIPDL